MIYIQQSEKLGRAMRPEQKKTRKKNGITLSFPGIKGEDTLNSPGHLMELIAAALGMSVSSYCVRSRTRDIVELRFIAVLFMRMYFPYVTLQQIAALFGGLDHSSIISGRARAYSLIYAGDASFTKKYNLALQAVNLWQEHMSSTAA